MGDQRRMTTTMFGNFAQRRFAVEIPQHLAFFRGEGNLQIPPHQQEGVVFAVFAQSPMIRESRGDPGLPIVEGFHGRCRGNESGVGGDLGRSPLFYASLP